MIKTEEGETFELNENCLLSVDDCRKIFEGKLEDKSLFEEELVNQLLQGKTLINAMIESSFKRDVCAVDIESEDGFFDGTCKKISIDKFVKDYLFGDSKTFVLNKKAMSEVMGTGYAFSETENSLFIKKFELPEGFDEEPATEETEYIDKTEELYSKELTIDTHDFERYESEFVKQESTIEEGQNDDAFTFNVAPVLETNEETDEILPMTDGDGEEIKDFCGEVMIKDKNNNDVMKAKDLKIDSKCFTKRHKQQKLSETEVFK